jgi:hypothetical protein
MLMPGIASLALHRSALAREAWASRGLREGQITMDDLARRVVVVLAGLVVDRGEDEPKWRRRHTEGEWLA